MLTRIRDLVSEPLTLDYFQQRQQDGWVLAAVEWVRKTSGGEEKSPQASEEQDLEDIPYGYRISEDCTHLARNKGEIETIETIFEKVVAGWRPAEIAQELNKLGLQTRRRQPWTAVTVFDLLPRLIEMSPQLLKRPEWPARRKALEIST